MEAEPHGGERTCPKWENVGLRGKPTGPLWEKVFLNEWVIF